MWILQWVAALSLAGEVSVPADEVTIAAHIEALPEAERAGYEAMSDLARRLAEES